MIEIFMRIMDVLLAFSFVFAISRSIPRPLRLFGEQIIL